MTLLVETSFGNSDVLVSSTCFIITLSFLQMTFEIEIPEQVIILDPRVSEKDETYARIVQVFVVC